MTSKAERHEVGRELGPTSRPVVAAPPLAVVIVSYRQPELLERCLRSLEPHDLGDEQPPEVWVVDNGSGDAVKAVVARFPGVRLIANRRNIGYGAAVNLALQRIESPHVLVLNQDVVVFPGCLSALVEVLRARPEVGIVGCRLIRPDGSLDHACRRSFPTLLGALGHFCGLGRRSWAPKALAQYRAPDLDRPGPVDAVNGAFMLIRRSALQEVGTFDERYWMYGEDLDLCWRFAQRGWVVWYEPRASAEHVKGASTGRHRRLRENRAFHAAMLRFYRTYEAPRRPGSVNAAVYGVLGLKSLLSVAYSAAARGLLRVRAGRC